MIRRLLACLAGLFLIAAFVTGCKDKVTNTPVQPNSSAPPQPGAGDLEGTEGKPKSASPPAPMKPGG